MGSSGTRISITRMASSVLRQEKLDALAPLLLPLVRPSILLKPGRPAKARGIAGKSRLGGCPDLPPATAWPADKRKRPLSFLLQVALGDLPILGDLPSTGMLSFFYDTLNLPDGREALTSGTTRVLFFRSDQCTSLAPRDPPADQDGPTTDTFEEFSFKASLVPSFPDSPHLIEDEDLGERYFDAILNPDRPIFKLLGHPNTIQSPMQMQCAKVARDIDPEAGRVSRAMAAKLKAEAEQWELLLQVDSAESMQLRWGDNGRLYFWIHRKDLKNGRFGKTMIWFQSH